MKNNIFSVLGNTCKKPCKIKGRSNRKEYIVFNLCFLFVFYCLYFLIFQINNLIIVISTFIFLAISAIISFCLTIRRLHDINFSSYWITISIPLSILAFIIESKTSEEIYFELVMYYLTVLHLFLIFFKGTPGPNKYGPPPEY